MKCSPAGRWSGWPDSEARTIWTTTYHGIQLRNKVGLRRGPHLAAPRGTRDESITPVVGIREVALKVKETRTREKKKHNTMAVTLHTNLGDLKCEIFCDEVPRTAENFLALCASEVRRGQFDTSARPRVLKARVFQLLESTVLSSDWFQIDSTCTSLHRVLQQHELPPQHQGLHDPGRGPHGHRTRRDVHLGREVPRRDPRHPQAQLARHLGHGRGRAERNNTAIKKSVGTNWLEIFFFFFILSLNPMKGKTPPCVHGLALLL